MNLFYAEPEDIRLPEIIIRDQEAAHIVKVLRYTDGDKLSVTDGKGTRYECEITRISKSLLVAHVTETATEKKREPHVTLCIGIIKKRDRLEFAVEKAVELGVDEIRIFRGDYSQKQSIRADRLKAAALSAMKQSMRCFLPEIRLESSLEKAVKHRNKDSVLIAADEIKEEQETIEPAYQDLFLVVGPEGGFSEKERQFLKASEAVLYSLGKKRLRTETAAMIMVDRFKNR